ncbi:MAG: type II secretion system protein M [Desulfobacteraceae bacterium]|nr:type II secretion system protein M [Desulfobacteraceae bacterium]
MNKLKEYFSGLEQREKNFLIAGIIFLSVFVLVNFLFLPVIDYKKELQTKIYSYNYQADQIKRLGQEYRKLVKNSGSYSISENSDIALFSFMDSLAGKAQIKENIDYMKPSSEKTDGKTIEKVEIKLSGIDMKRLIQFLYSIESSSDAIVIKGLRISRSDKGAYITSTIQAEIVKNNV